jgi:hypothetical protein
MIGSPPAPQPISGQVVGSFRENGYVLGYLWFFAPTNVEVVVKVLDGCGVDGHYWVFAGGLTNVAVTIVATDTQTGAMRTYTNPQGTAFHPLQDTGAFSTCP